MEVKSKGTFGLGFAEVTIRMRREKGDIDEIYFPSIFIGDGGLSELIIYEEDDDIVDDLTDQHVTRIKRQDVKIVLGGTLEAVPNEPLFKIRLDVNGVKDADDGLARIDGGS